VVGHSGATYEEFDRKSGEEIATQDPDYFDRRYAIRVTRRAVQALERQGYRVTLEPAA
jgi:hypothetical protein